MTIKCKNKKQEQASSLSYNMSQTQQFTKFHNPRCSSSREMFNRKKVNRQTDKYTEKKTKAIYPINPCPAEPGYTLSLQTV